MSTKIPLTLDGRLAADPESGVTKDDKAWTRFDLAVNDRRFNDETKQWEDGDVVFHKVAVFGKQAENVARSLRKGDSAIVSGELRFGRFEKDNGDVVETRTVYADQVGASLQYRSVEIDRAPKAKGPEAYATGPVATPEAQSGAQVAR